MLIRLNIVVERKGVTFYKLLHAIYVQFSNFELDVKSLKQTEINPIVNSKSK